MSLYPDSLNVRPLTTWPGTLTHPGERRRAPYSAALASTLSNLGAELRAISAVTSVLEVAVPPEQWRLDGRPRANAVPDHPGVVLSLPGTVAGPLRFACDQWDLWQANLRAIVLTMAALRAVERHGAVAAREQYRGFAQLTAAPEPSKHTRRERAALDLEQLAGLGSYTAEAILARPAARQAAYRHAARLHHPDAGGDREQWDRVEAATQVLG